MRDLTRSGFVSLTAAPALGQTAERVERWGVWELALHGPAEGNPFLDVSFGAVFAGGGRRIRLGTTQGCYGGPWRDVHGSEGYAVVVEGWSAAWGEPEAHGRVFAGKTEVQLPGRPHLALRLRRL